MQELAWTMPHAAVKYNYATYTDGIFNDTQARLANNGGITAQAHLSDEDWVNGQGIT
jgi:hypothetical protein